jgi:alkanesulfonate monooxygenase SsuD/methylene tetrahydromethanopterin reductase-like flavin-dependent oxidoreductase (luciferase family)
LPLPELAPLAQRAEAAGYTDLWSAESVGYDGFAPLAVAAVATKEVRLATGIVNPFTRGRTLLAQSCATLQDLSGGRFVLGLGASSNVIVEQWNGIPFEKPLRRVREMVEYLRVVLAGERGDGGFKLPAPPVAPIPIVLAALRDRMLRLAREQADGAFTNFVPLSGVPQVVEAFGAAEKELACRFFCFLGDEEEALVRA